MATRKTNDDAPVEVKEEEQTQAPDSNPEPGADQTSADAQAAFNESTEEYGTDMQVDRKRRTERSTDHRERAAAKVAGPSRKRPPQADRTMVRIKLHNNKEIPPGGQHVGVNGNWVKIPPNEWVTIPEEYVEALDNAVRSEPVRNDNNQVVDYREVPRFPYSVDRQFKG